MFNNEGVGVMRKDMYWQQIHWPGKVEPDHALQLLRHIAADHRNRLVIFEVRSGKQGLVHFLVGCQQTYMPFMKQLIESHIEGAFVTSPTINRVPLQKVYGLQPQSRTRPLRVEHSKLTAKAILATIAQVEQPERAALQLILGPRLRPIAVPTRTEESVLMPWWRRLVSAGDGSRIDREKRTAYRVKVATPGFRCALQIGVSTPEKARHVELGLDITSGVRTAEARGSYLHVRRLLRSARFNLPTRLPFFSSMRLNINELLGLSAWPLGGDAMPGLDRHHYRLLYADSSTESSQRIIARATAPGDKRLLGLNFQDALHHLHVLGPTGVGKSTLLLNLATQDITAGHGVVVIDPKGDLVQEVLRRVPPERSDDVIVLDPADTTAPVGLNPLQGITAQEEPAIIADHVLAVFHGLYKDAWGPRTQDILHASLLTLANHQNSSLVMLPTLLTDPYFRRSFVDDIRDPIALGPFWRWYEQLSPAEQQQAIAPVMNKLRSFLLRPQVRGVIGQTQPRFSLQDVFSGQKILLVSLAKGLLGTEAAALFGSLLVAQLRQATLGRTAEPAASRRPVSVFIDEFQDYMHLPNDLADVLAQARGLGVAMTLAHQHLDQLTPAMRMAVLANARSRVCFQLPSADASTIAHMSDLLEPDDFMKLGRHEVYASLVSRGQGMPFASGKTRPAPAAVASQRQLRQASRSRYGQSVADSELRLLDQLQATAAPEIVGRHLRLVTEAS